MTGEMIGPVGFPYVAGEIAALDIDPVAKEMMYEAHRQAVWLEAANARIDVLEEANQTAEELSRKDSLTGLFNRRGFEDVYDSLLPGLMRDVHDSSSPSIGSFITFDLDRFKSINDTLGHAEGDRTLINVARAAETALRHGDVLARLGGDEFAAFLPKTTLVGASLVADKLRGAIKYHANTGTSVGVAEAPSSGLLKDGLRLADDFLYVAKGQGRGKVVSGKIFKFLDLTIQESQ